MPKGATVLTARSVTQIKPKRSRQEIADALLPGLYLVIQPSGSRAFALRYRDHNDDGRHVKLTLGPAAVGDRQAARADGELPTLGAPLTLAEARELGRALKTKVIAGAAPHVEKREQYRKQEAGVLSREDELAAIIEEFLERHVRRRLRPTTIRDMEGMFRRYVLPAWGRRHLDEIRRADVVELLDQLVDEGKGATSNRLRRQLHTFFSWCADRELVESSPVARVRKPHQDRPRERFLSDPEIRWLWRATEDIGFPFGPMVRLLLLTGCRREEITAATWHEFDLKAGTWLLPSERVKNAKAHVVFLSAEAQAILTALPRIKNPLGLIFTTTGRTPVSGWSRAKRRIDAAMIAAARAEHRAAGGDDAEVPKIESWSFHDLRRTFATTMARLGIALPVIERCLNHISGSFSGVAGTYQKFDFSSEKRAAWATWGRHIQATVAADAGAVVPFRRAGQIR